MREGQLAAVLDELRAAKSRPGPKATEDVAHAMTRFPWCPVGLYLVPDRGAAKRLMATGIPRGHILTLADAVAWSKLPPAEARRAVLARLARDGEQDRSAKLARPRGTSGRRENRL